MVKVDLITGFLGSGKTTFIKEYAKYLLSKGLKIGILENDYGAVNVDMMLLGELRGEKCELEMIAGGCDYDCHKRRFKTKLISMAMMGYDRVLIEPSGIYDVDEFFDVLYEEPLDNWYEIGNVITILDANLEENMTQESDYLLACQAAKAGKVVLSRINEASKNEIDQTIDHLNRALETCKASRKIDKQTDVIVKKWNDFSNEDWEKIETCGYQSADYVKQQITEENNYDSLYFMNKRMPLEKLQSTVKEILEDSSCGNVFRIKGFMWIEDDSWVEINANHKGISIRPVEKGQEVVIVIGEHMVEENINRYWN